MLSGTSVKPPQLDEFFLDFDRKLRREEMERLGLASEPQRLAIRMPGSSGPMVITSFRMPAHASAKIGIAAHLRSRAIFCHERVGAKVASSMDFANRQRCQKECFRGGRHPSACAYGR